MTKPVTSAEIEANIKAPVSEIVQTTDKTMGGMKDRLKGKLNKVEEQVDNTNMELQKT